MQTFHDFWYALTPTQKQQLAADANTSYDTLRQIAKGHRNAGAILIERLMEADARITFRLMRNREVA